MLRLLEVDDLATLPARIGPFDRKLFEGLYAIDDNARLALFQRGRLAEHIKNAKTRSAAEEE
ncbi:hypothetical protein [Erythrobacter litoralis]|uniref:hypothetical protein n=1 Tax=Erythrobacter litoralis TaxID=39960 RepID=UPI00004EB9F9|nr:hypothetical protein [Erythrobacter litoralis]